MGVDHVLELGGAAADLNFHVADLISHGRDRLGRRRRHLVAIEQVGGAGSHADAQVVVRHDGRAFLLEQRIPIDVVAVIVRVDHILHRQRRDLRDRRLDLVV